MLKMEWGWIVGEELRLFVVFREWHNAWWMMFKDQFVSMVLWWVLFIESD